MFFSCVLFLVALARHVHSVCLATVIGILHTRLLSRFIFQVSVKVRVYFRTNPHLKLSFFHRAVDSSIEIILVPRNFPGGDQGWGRQRKPGHDTEQE